MAPRWLRRLGRTLFGSGDDTALAEELRTHAEMEADELEKAGVPRDEARRRALVALGSSARFREETRDVRALPWLSGLLRDAGYSLRTLRSQPGFTGIVVLTLGLGIGANATFFSILNALVLKPLPVHDPAALVTIGGDEWTNPIWEAIRERQSQIFDGAFAWSPTAFDLSGNGETEPVDGAYVSGDFFRVLGVAADLGRVLTTDDDRRDGGVHGPVVVISHRFWQSRFGGASDVIGQRMTVDRVPFTIVGVLPASFLGLDVGRALDVMLPIGVKTLIRRDPHNLDARSTWWLHIGGRLQPGQTVEQAQAALRAVQPHVRDATVPPQFVARQAAEYLSEPFTLQSAATGRSAVRSLYQPALAAIMGVVGLVLLIACANVANLMLARATTRQREFSVRLALGGTRRRITQQLLVESLLLAAMGAAAGLLIAFWGGEVVVRQLTTWRDSVVLDLAIDWRVFGFLVGVTGLTAVLFGLAPAWSVRAASPQEALRQGGRGSTGDRRMGLRNLLVVGQIALSLVLLVGAGLFLRTFVSVSAAPTGLIPAGLTAIELNLDQSSVPRDRRAEHIDRLRQAAARVPGVLAATGSVVTPLSGSGWNAGIGETFPPARNQMSWMNAVTPGWFAAVGARVLEGRDFADADVPGGVPVAIVNESFARKFLEPGSAVGQQVRVGGPSGSEQFNVVGLTSDVMYRRPREGMVPTLFVSAGQSRREVSLVVRFAPGQQATATRALAEEIRRSDPDIAFTFRPFDELVRATVNQERLIASLSAAFGVLALLLAAIGLYGVMSYSVNRRRSELAVRMALGADRSSISRLVVGQGAGLVAAGILLGGVSSWWVSGYVQALLFGIGAHDALTMGGAATILGAVGILAAWIPARRASNIDPAGLLRSD
jgi:predicted permease